MDAAKYAGVSRRSGNERLATTEPKGDVTAYHLQVEPVVHGWVIGVRPDRTGQLTTPRRFGPTTLNAVII